MSLDLVSEISSSDSLTILEKLALLEVVNDIVCESRQPTRLGVISLTSYLMSRVRGQREKLINEEEQSTMRSRVMFGSRGNN